MVTRLTCPCLTPLVPTLRVGTHVPTLSVPSHRADGHARPYFFFSGGVIWYWTPGSALPLGGSSSSRQNDQ
jgi:hypothetical protein